MDVTAPDRLTSAVLFHLRSWSPGDAETVAAAIDLSAPGGALVWRVRPDVFLVVFDHCQESADVIDAAEAMADLVGVRLAEHDPSAAVHMSVVVDAGRQSVRLKDLVARQVGHRPAPVPS